MKTELRVGDTVSIGIVEIGNADVPGERRKEDSESVAKAQRRYYERLKREYGE